MPAELQIIPNAAALYRQSAQEFVRAAESALRNAGRFAVALSGGNTPRGVYALLAEEYADQVSWSKVHIFFGDERSVPPDHPDSNYRMAHESLLSRVAIPAENIHRFRTELGIEPAAADYEQQLRGFFHPPAGQWPRFDLVLLGLGDDGHTASLFPGTAALEESSRMVVANWVEKLRTFRLTLTLPVLNHAAEALFLVSGAGKAEILKDVLGGPATLPSQRIQPEDGRLLWLVDQDAARLLDARNQPGLKLL
jgi:6-phosphogluconolactonase